MINKNPMEKKWTEGIINAYVEGYGRNLEPARRTVVSIIFGQATPK